MPRTTLDLDATVLRELKRRAKLERKSMGRVASETLARALRRSDAVSRAEPFAWISRDLGEPRVDLEDKEALRRAVEGH